MQTSKGVAALLALQISHTAFRLATTGPHLDRNPGEAGNSRELTLIVYLHEGPYDPTSGGCLRLLPSPEAPREAAAVEAAPTASEGVAENGASPLCDVEPRAGRGVVFRSASQWHAVAPALAGSRLAITLWVEFDDGETEGGA